MTEEVSLKNLARFKRAVKQLNNVISDCKKENPSCFAYLDGNNSFHLMDGTEEPGESSNLESVLEWEYLSATGGDW